MTGPRDEAGPTRSAGPPPPKAARFIVVMGVVAVVIGVLQALKLAWTSDDAYISFRYARNLVEGLGLVFNAGERVEGYTNFLWTLWCALGLKLGFTPEGWSDASSIACFAMTITLLAWLTWRSARAGIRGTLLPLAALMMAVNRDVCVFATGGLETALFTLLAVAGYAALAGIGSGAAGDSRRAAVGALLFALTTLTRPDGALFAAVGAVYVLAVARPRLRAALAYAAVSAAIGLPYAWWKLSYYGDLLPNTYYAKSAMIPWWDQGWVYASLYFERYPALVVGPVLVLLLGPFAWRVGRRADGRAQGVAHTRYAPAALAAALALAYTACVMRVGGDFMFARLLIPVTPFCALALESALGPLAADLVPSGWLARTAAVPGVLALPLVAFAPPPFDDIGRVRGVVDERLYYQGIDRGSMRRRAEELQELTRGLPVRAVIAGTQAISAYYSRIPVAIEASTGLTDSYIAHMKLALRGRVGHEKRAPYSYLVDLRRAQIHVGHPASEDVPVDYIPKWILRYKVMKATVLTWDPALMAELKRRGAKFDDYPSYLDRFIGAMPAESDSAVADVYRKARRFYFEGVSDTARENLFLRRLGIERGETALAGTGRGFSDAPPPSTNLWTPPQR